METTCNSVNVKLGIKVMILVKCLIDLEGTVAVRESEYTIIGKPFLQDTYVVLT